MSVSYSVDETVEAYTRGREAFATEYPTGIFNSYQDGKLIEKLLRAGHDPELLKQVVAEHSTVANQPGKYAIGYAQNAVTKSLEVVKAIQQLQELQDALPPNLRDYKQFANELLVKEAAAKMTASFDIRIAGKMLDAGHTLEQIQEAVSLTSPIAKEPGRHSGNYAKYIIQQAAERQVLYQKRQQKLDANYDKAVSEYLRQAQNIIEANPERELNNYWDGRIAAEMLVKGYEKENVIKAIAEISPAALKLHQDKGLESGIYAKSIVYHALESLKRQEAAYSLPERTPIDASPVLEYQYQLKAILDNAGTPNQFVDTQIAKAMLVQQIQENDIINALYEASPVASAPGRISDRYAAMVVQNAKELLEKHAFHEAFRKMNKQEIGGSNKC